MTSTLSRNSHFIVGESTIDEIPDLWLIQYVKAIQADDRMQMSIIKQLTGLSNTELLDLIDDRKLIK
jgi:hypothetical protein